MSGAYRTRRALLASGIAWIVTNDDITGTDVHATAAKKIDYLSGVVSIALLADLAGVKTETVARRVLALARSLGRGV